MLSRTGHNYGNYIVDDRLYWSMKSNHNLETNSGKDLLSGKFKIRIFIRFNNQDKFTYAGLGIVSDYGEKDENWITWKIIPEESNQDNIEKNTKIRKKFLEKKK